jgi:dihydroflavonol-4-reductase
MSHCGSDLKKSKSSENPIQERWTEEKRTFHKIFVTGGNGFLGSATVRRLVDSGYEVHCLLRQKSDFMHWGDVLDLNSLLQATLGCDAIIHLACISAWNQILKLKDQLQRVAIEGTRNVLEAARINKILRVVHVSSAAAINASSDPIIFNESTPYRITDSRLFYSQMKHQSEMVVADYIKRFQTPVVIVNPCEVYGENDHQFVTAGNLLVVLQGKVCFIPQGGMALAHVEDISRGIVLAMEKGRLGERYILAGENLNLKEFARIVRKIAGKNTWVLQVPGGLLRWICKTMKQLGLTPPTPPEILDYAVLYWFMDSSKAAHELGYQFRSAEETLKSTLDWLLSRNHTLRIEDSR